MSTMTARPSPTLKFLSTVACTALLFSLLVLPNHGVSAHVLITPALGVTGAPKKADVTRTSGNSPCGNGVDVAKALTVSEGNNADVVHAAANGQFTITAASFDAGSDGSTFIANSLLDTSGTGKSFDKSSVDIIKNGDRSPSSSTSTSQVTASFPPNTKCSGGKDGQSCLVSFTTSSGFGNCVLVSQSAAAGNGTGDANANAKKNDVEAARLVRRVSGTDDANEDTTTSEQKQNGDNKNTQQKDKNGQDKQDKNKKNDKQDKNKQNGGDKKKDDKKADDKSKREAKEDKKKQDDKKDKKDDKKADDKGKREAKEDKKHADKKDKKKEDKKKSGKTAAAGSRLARSLKMRAELGEALERKRSWVWAN